MDTPRIDTKEPVLVLTRAADKLLSLKPGEVIRAQVVSVLPGGEVSLRIMGNLFHAKSALPLPQNAAALFRVLGQTKGESAPEVRLQFMEVIVNPETTQVTQSSSAGILQTLAHELAANLPIKGEVPEEFATTVEQLLKALPDDPTALPKGIREQLLNLLQTGLRNTEQSIQNRVNLLLTEPLIKELPESLGLAGLKEHLFADIEKVLQISLKSTLENTGVGLEARLKALARALPPEGDVPLNGPFPAPRDGRSPEMGHLQTDLKARLLQLKEMLLNHEKQAWNDTAPSQAAGEKKEAPGGMLQVVDGLLRDVETFQLLSKLTDSFYTFLPLIWKGLNEAEIAFKRGRSGAHGKSYYCLMHLDFERIGKLTIVAMMQSQDFFVSFKTDHDDLRSVLNSHVHELHQMFAEQGLNLQVVKFFEEGEKQLAPFERLESFESIINIKI